MVTLFWIWVNASSVYAKEDSLQYQLMVMLENPIRGPQDPSYQEYDLSLRDMWPIEFFKRLVLPSIQKPIQDSTSLISKPFSSAKNQKEPFSTFS